MSEGGDGKGGEVEDSRVLQAVLFAFLLLLAGLVILTCIWKIVKLIAVFKMESRIEELEQMTANGTPQEMVLSPKEARLVRLFSLFHLYFCNLAKMLLVEYSFHNYEDTAMAKKNHHFHFQNPEETVYPGWL